MSRSTLAAAVALALAATLVSGSAAIAGRVVHITGGGWGHGIGMSQYGAYGRALWGEGDRKILTHYYTGAHVRKVAMPAHIRVGLLQGQSAISISSIALNAKGGTGVFRVSGAKKWLARGGPSVSWRVTPSSTGGLHLYRDGKLVKRNGSAVFGHPGRGLVFIYREHGSMVHVADKSNNYKFGRMHFGTYSSSSCGVGFCVRLVDALPMGKYLYGLGEVPASWPLAALQSQVIAARTYAYQKVRTSGQHRYPCDCAVYDSTIDQVYLGDAKRTSSGRYWHRWKTAVNSTAGQVLLDHSRPIEALYMSSSGGYTENNENVWGGAPISYLRGVPDRADAVAANPNHSWKLSMPWSTFAAKLRSSYNVGAVHSFRLVPPFGVSGRVTVVKPGVGGGARIAGSNGVVRTSGWAVKSALGLKDTLFRVKVTFTVAKTFASRYRKLHGRPGQPRTKLYAVPKHAKHRRGLAQDFTHGRMTWNRARKKVVWQRGPVLRRYDAMGRERSALGMPVSGVWVLKSYQLGRYAGGNIYWSKGTGAHAVRGPYLKTYRTYGGPSGPLSLPLGPRAGGKNFPHHGVRQRFLKGTIYRSSSSARLFALWGGLDKRYRRMGAARSACGYPTSSMQPHKRGLIASFAHGSIRLTHRGAVLVNCGG